MNKTNEKNKKSTVRGSTYRELREEAKNMGIPRYSQMRKRELTKAINYRKANPKVRFRPRKQVKGVSTSPTTRATRTKYEAAEIPKKKPLVRTKVAFAKKESIPVSETEIGKRKAKHKEESKMYLKKHNIRSISDYLKYMMVEYDPESKESMYKAKKLAGYVEYLIEKN